MSYQPPAPFPPYRPQQPQPYQQQQPYYPPLPYFPQRAVTRGRLNPIETLFHLFMTFATMGLWGFVWWARVRSRTSVTRYR